MDIKKQRLNHRYDIKNVLAQGGFSTVYLARDTLRGNEVAIKQGSSRREVEILEQVSGREGIVPVFDSFLEEKEVYYVMPFFSGGTLRIFREKNQKIPSEMQVLSLLEPIFYAVRSLHQSGIIHRDISPDNVMLDARGKRWLIDFGAAKRINDDGIETSVQIRHGYAPPEQYSLEEEQAAWTDIYALCAVIYYMVTGANPVSAKDRKNGVRLLTLNELGMSSRRFSDCVEKGMELEIKKRFRSMDEMIKAFGKTEERGLRWIQ